jgi:hypothetical protein
MPWGKKITFSFREKGIKLPSPSREKGIKLFWGRRELRNLIPSFFSPHNF